MGGSHHPRPLLSTATRRDRSIACKQTQDPVALATATARSAAERALRVAARPLALLACELRAGARGRPVGIAPETCARGAATARSRLNEPVIRPLLLFFRAASPSPPYGRNEKTRRGGHHPLPPWSDLSTSSVACTSAVPVRVLLAFLPH